ncbi:unnamed protein product [Cladocopium goreaui]|uniref:Uncharacterized protein n=1 Tax=Cladocopium goreaui TaxID=2562237 RepID=A0A9P1C920_9DINO|nr:unnamed protein product [Cladocopium goreaui]
MRLLPCVCFRFARGTLSRDTIAFQTNRRGGRCSRRAEPTAEERKAAQELLKDSPVGQMAGSMGQDGAQRHSEWDVTLFVDDRVMIGYDRVQMLIAV